MQTATLRAKSRQSSPFWASLAAAFAARKKRLGYVMLLIVATWVSVFLAIQAGRPPLFSWMLMACISVVVLGMLTWQAYLKIPVGGVAKLNLASLLFQLAVIFVGNTVVLVRLAFDFRWSFFDTLNICMGLSLFAVFFLLTLVRRIRIRIHRPQWLFELEWKRDWAKFYYVMTLKVIPQFTSAVTALITDNGLALWAAIPFVLLAGTRLDDALVGNMMPNRSMASKALAASAWFDLSSLIFLATSSAIVLVR